MITSSVSTNIQFGPIRSGHVPNGDVPNDSHFKFRNRSGLQTVSKLTSLLSHRALSENCCLSVDSLEA